MKATHQLFGNPFEHFDQSKAGQGFGVDVRVTERQEDVYYLMLRVYCPALLNPPFVEVPIRTDGRHTCPLEMGGQESDCEAFLNRDEAVFMARWLERRMSNALRYVFDLFREQASAK